MDVGPATDPGIDERDTEVLLVAEDRAVLNTPSVELESRFDADVIRTECGVDAALDYLDRSDVDCVIAGFDAPRRVGLELLREIRRERSDLPFILVDGTGTAALLDEALAAEATDFIELDGEPRYDLLTRRVETVVTGRLAQRNLEESERRYQSLLESSPGPVFIYSLAQELIYVNQAGLDLLDAPDKDDLIGTASGEFTHPDSEPLVADRCHRLVQDREPVAPTELKLRSFTGETKYAIMASTPVTYEGQPAIQTVGMDITEAKHREQQLQRERDRFSTLFQNLPSPVVYGALADGKPIIRDVNTQFEELFGVDAAAVAGENLDEVIVPPDRQDEAAFLNRKIAKKGIIREEVRRETTNGLRDFELRVVIDSETDPPEGYAIYTDITERKERERQLHRQNDRLEAFADMVSHDLRNPLTVARGQLELARRESESERLDDVAKAHDRMAELIEDVLGLARQGQPIDTLEVVSLDSLAKRSWDLIETGSADLTVANDRRFRADPNRVRQLIENLLGNAVDHGGDDVTVRVGPTGEQGFYIADDGPGIPRDSRDEVFVSGYSTADTGTGFGLAIVKEIVDAHGWSVDIRESELGGTRFEITGIDTPD